tara:strand:+ start:634 stop:1020 length:387 start_codon:yes stop_codon:yes gene_type:complete
VNKLKKFTLRINNKEYKIQAERLEEAEKIKVNIDGIDHVVEILEESEQSNKNQIASHSPRNIKSPLPGEVLSIEVTVGEIVSSGTKLLVLEAMKMENIITAETDGKISDILVSKGDKVEAGQELIKIE